MRPLKPATRSPLRPATLWTTMSKSPAGCWAGSTRALRRSLRSRLRNRSTGRGCVGSGAGAIPVSTLSSRSGGSDMVVLAGSACGSVDGPDVNPLRSYRHGGRTTYTFLLRIQRGRLPGDAAPVGPAPQPCVPGSQPVAGRRCGGSAPFGRSASVRPHAAHRSHRRDRRRQVDRLVPVGGTRRRGRRRRPHRARAPAAGHPRLRGDGRAVRTRASWAPTASSTVRRSPRSSSPTRPPWPTWAPSCTRGSTTRSSVGSTNSAGPDASWCSTCRCWSSPGGRSCAARSSSTSIRRWPSTGWSATAGSAMTTPATASRSRRAGPSDWPQRTS